MRRYREVVTDLLCMDRLGLDACDIFGISELCWISVNGMIYFVWIGYIRRDDIKMKKDAEFTNMYELLLHIYFVAMYLSPSDHRSPIPSLLS